MDIAYTNDAESLTANQLEGFFVEWPEHPDPITHLGILRGSYAVWLAFDQERCVGFINALSDGILYAYIPLLEVLPEYKGRGIGTELLRRMIETLGSMYAIDIVCDESVASFYAAKGFGRCAGMIKRNFASQGAANQAIQRRADGLADLTLSGSLKLTFTKEGKVSEGVNKPHRIAAGGLIFKGNAVLLVRYRDNEGTFLVGPGGVLDDNENIVQAIIRETKEETGVTVEPKQVVAIEDLMCTRFKMIKVWMVCEIVEGEIHKTDGAEIEGIIEAAWFTKDQLTSEVVFPPSLMKHDWEQFRTETWQVECLPPRKADRGLFGNK